ncbi:hypothetical protein C8J57DRAFT_1522394 [Mycena rebaudengoi]|nr:hypothetical protein C8J57DRAFT_1522394 [Mycena rebaudengoi]
MVLDTLRTIPPTNRVREIIVYRSLIGEKGREQIVQRLAQTPLPYLQTLKVQASAAGTSSRSLSDVRRVRDASINRHPSSAYRSLQVLVSTRLHLDHALAPPPPNLTFSPKCTSETNIIIRLTSVFLDLHRRLIRGQERYSACVGDI